MDFPKIIGKNTVRSVNCSILWFDFTSFGRIDLKNMKKLSAFMLVTVFCLLLQVTAKFGAASKLKNSFKHGSRIIRGTPAATHNTMHQASLRRRASDSGYFGSGHICGGSLISPNIVLSAAHCFTDFHPYNPSYYPKGNFIVVMGNLDRYEKNNNTLVFDIKDIAYGVEPFDESTFDKDIALLFLNGSVPANHPTVRPIIINRLPVEAGTICQVTGWGYTETGSLPSALMTVDVPIISTEVCQTETEFDEGAIIDGMMCAGYLEGKRDACGGDSGGPLVCNGLLTGIVSWGDGCALPFLPGVYTDVEFYEIWIEEKVTAYGGTLEGTPTYVFL